MLGTATIDHIDPTLLPTVRGRYQYDVSLSQKVWFRVGGTARVFFKPADLEDLSYFLQKIPKNVPYTVIGAGSNLLIRDGGFQGVVIRLDRAFATIRVENDLLRVGAGALDRNVALIAADHGLAGLEFLVGIPGRIGGGIVMNAGAYEQEIKDIFVSCVALDPTGKKHELTAKEMAFSYRHSALPEGWIVVEAIFRGKPDGSVAIKERLNKILDMRESSQPTRARTGGSTFKNPSGSSRKAWELIDAAGCRGLVCGKAMVSEKHCNFLINQGGASAQDLEGLAEEVRHRVKEKLGIELEWEIKRLGTPELGVPKESKTSNEGSENICDAGNDR